MKRSLRNFFALFFMFTYGSKMINTVKTFSFFFSYSEGIEITKISIVISFKDVTLFYRNYYYT